MKRAELINRVIVETSEGDRAFLLLEGDILSEPADVYVFNTYKVGEKQYGGSLVNRLHNFFGVNEINEEPFFTSTDGIKVTKVQINNAIILLIHTDIVEFQKITTEQYKLYIDIIFTSLTALQIFKPKIKTIAFPVLLRNCLDNLYNDAIKILIDNAMDWLKNASSTETIKYVLYEMEDSKLWNESLNEYLGRKVIALNAQPKLNSIKNDVLSDLYRFSETNDYWHDILLPMKNSLESKRFLPESLAAFSRKLVEVFSSNLCKVNNLSTQFPITMNQSFRLLEKEQVLNPVYVQMFRQIRAFGNPSIHRPYPLIGPNEVDNEDVVILLIAISEVLKLLNDFLQTNEGSK